MNSGVPAKDLHAKKGNEGPAASGEETDFNDLKKQCEEAKIPKDDLRPEINPGYKESESADYIIGSCLLHLAEGFVENIWGIVTFSWDMLVAGAKALYHMPGEVWELLKSIFHSSDTLTVAREIQNTDKRTLTKKILDFVKTAPGAIMDLALEQYSELECYSKAGKARLACGTIGYLGTDVLMFIPGLQAGAIAKIKKLQLLKKAIEGAKLLKGVKIALKVAEVAANMIEVSKDVAKALPATEFVLDTSSGMLVLVKNGKVYVRNASGKTFEVTAKPLADKFTAAWAKIVHVSGLPEGMVVMRPPGEMPEELSVIKMAIDHEKLIKGTQMAIKVAEAGANLVEVSKNAAMALPGAGFVMDASTKMSVLVKDGKVYVKNAAGKIYEVTAKPVVDKIVAAWAARAVRKEEAASDYLYELAEGVEDRSKTLPKKFTPDSVLGKTDPGSALYDMPEGKAAWIKAVSQDEIKNGKFVGLRTPETLAQRTQRLAGKVMRKPGEDPIKLAEKFVVKDAKKNEVEFTRVRNPDDGTWWFVSGAEHAKGVTRYPVYVDLEPTRIKALLPELLTRGSKSGAYRFEVGGSQEALESGQRMTVWFTDARKAQAFEKSMSRKITSDMCFHRDHVVVPKIGLRSCFSIGTIREAAWKRAKAYTNRTITAATLATQSCEADPICECHVYLNEGINPTDGQPLDLHPFDCDVRNGYQEDPDYKKEHPDAADNWQKAPHGPKDTPPQPSARDEVHLTPEWAAKMKPMPERPLTFGEWDQVVAALQQRCHLTYSAEEKQDLEQHLVTRWQPKFQQLILNMRAQSKPLSCPKK